MMVMEQFLYWLPEDADEMDYCHILALLKEEITLCAFTFTFTILAFGRRFYPEGHTMASAWISACLVDISSWMMAHQLKLNPSKTELLVIPGSNLSPQYQGVLPTITSFLQEELLSLLSKGAIEYVPLPDRDSAFFPPLFHCVKEGRGLHPVLDLRALNSALRKFRFKRLTTKLIASQIRAEDWFVTIDLKDAYFHIGIQPEHRKFLRFAFGGKVYQFRVLPFGLALSPCPSRSAWMRLWYRCVSRAYVYSITWTTGLAWPTPRPWQPVTGCGARAYEVARPQNQPREVCAFSISEKLLPGSDLDSTRCSPIYLLLGWLPYCQQ
ncbi:hypothetical protein QTP86_034361 [Hemibagrus guttatus]|nr:hypothetical protein QTP86_034361 [Hemibagrus guttatus]